MALLGVRGHSWGVWSREDWTRELRWVPFLGAHSSDQQKDMGSVVPGRQHPDWWQLSEEGSEGPSLGLSRPGLAFLTHLPEGLQSS